MGKKLSILIFTMIATVIAHAGTLEDLRSLYPRQSPQTMNARLKNVESAFQFFRAFPPHFYLLLERGLLQSAPWSNLKNDRGWCVGDAHPENFGVLFGNQNRALYTVNDPDDGSICPVLTDLLRFQAAWSLAINRDVANPVLQAYLGGFAGKLPAQPPIVHAALAEAPRKGIEIPKKWLDKKGTLKRNDELVDLPTGTARFLLWYAEQTWGKRWKVEDMAERIRLTGGSGGLKRFLVLLKNETVKILIEFKEVSRPAPFPVGVPDMNDLQRIQSVLQWQQSPVITGWQTTSQVQGVSFRTRPIWEGNVDIDLEDIPGNQLQQMAEYQAALLGLLHKAGWANRRNDWPSKLNSIPAREWSQAMNTIVRETQKAYAEIERRF